MKSNVFLLILVFYSLASAQVPGCTDPVSSSYNPLATVNNGSCVYPSASISPVSSIELPVAVKETSGLVKWNGKLYTHNDGADTKLYVLDSISGAVVQSVTIPGVVNKDWEELAQDNSHLYIGDFGNNGNGNRNNLKIIKINKESVLAGAATSETINFTYDNQTNFTATGGNNTNFDCEAMIVSADSIYLFTKQWVSKKTSVYALPKTAGTHVAQLKETYNVGGLITGTAYVEDKRVVVLTGYSNLLQPFLYLLYDFQGHTFFSGNKRKIG
ncbi:MAG: T9SS C-terminal target domain-containing protein, partial [Flavobacterium sp.]